MSSKPIPKMNADEKLAHMTQAIESGGSALYEGRVISNIADLPNKSELAVTQAERETALADIATRRKALEAEEQRLRISSASDVLLADDAPPTKPVATAPPAKPPAK